MISLLSQCVKRHNHFSSYGNVPGAPALQQVWDAYLIMMRSAEPLDWQVGGERGTALSRSLHVPRP